MLRGSRGSANAKATNVPSDFGSNSSLYHLPLSLHFNSGSLIFLPCLNLNINPIFPTYLEVFTAHNTSQASCHIRDRSFFKDRLSDKHVPQLVTSPLYPNPVTHYPR